ncbi:amino acid permease-domain-containing protein [Dipodascopsis tothii]|uniref:amino acid permease-domain-containing protein n=1 Tax=Dipodascopsis tothii TaxID=44089 RepID=UPI0034CF656A
MPAVRDSFELASLASSSDGSLSRSRSDSRRLSTVDDLDSRGSMRQLGSFDSARRGSFGGSLFEYGEHLYPLAASADARADAAVPLERQKRLGVVNGLGLVVGLMIGSGIFSSPTQILVAGSPGAALVVWLVAGLLVWTGAASYAELGSAIPLSGGAQAYLHHIFGPLTSFLFSWTAVTIFKPGSTAIIAIVFAEYTGRALYSLLPAPADDGSGGVPRAVVDAISPEWFNKLIAIAAIVLITVVNMLSTRMGTRAGDVFMFLKVGLLGAITLLGLGVLALGKGAGNFAPGWFEGTSAAVDDYAFSLYAALWAFDGWDNLNYVTAEMKNATRDLPRVIHLSMPIVIVSYLAANVGYFAVLSRDELASSNTVALAFGQKLFGHAGGIVFTVGVALSCLGALNAITFTSARLIYVCGKDGFIPARFGSISRRTGTPVIALLLNAVLTVAFVAVGEFATLLTFYGVAGYVFYFITVLGVVVLRVREPNLDRPYRTYITTPILFCCVALFLTTRGVFVAPLQSLFTALFVAAGVPIYYWRVGGGLQRMPYVGRVFSRAAPPAAHTQLQNLDEV